MDTPATSFDGHVPSQPALDLQPTPSRRRRWWTPRRVANACGIIVLALLLLGPVAAIRSAREAARRATCSCNFCSIALAFAHYHEVHGEYPPAHVDDVNGKPMHSWRVLILPYMDHGTLYNSYNFNEAWDGPNNRRLIPLIPNTYKCPSRESVGPVTSYVVVTGRRTMFPDGQHVRMQDIQDGTETTLLAVEIDRPDITWTEPRDLNIQTLSTRLNDPIRPSISSRHPGGANAVMVSGKKVFLSDKITPQQLNALLTIDGGEPLEPLASQ